MKTKTITSRSFGKRALMVLAVLFTTLTASATEFITDVMLIGTLEKTDKEALISKYQNEGWTLIEKDLNAGAGGDYIYLFYKSEENTDGVNHGYITDFYIYGSQNGNFEEKVTSGGRTYYLVPFDGSAAFKYSKGDLNRGCGKGTDYIHLYYTMDTQSDKAVSGIAFDNMPFNALGNMGLSGGISGYNLNAGCSSGENIYMHITTKNATTQTHKYIKYTYDTTNGLTKKEESCSGYHTVTSSTTTFGSAKKESWYVLNRSRNFDNRITVSGTVNLILCDGCMLEAKKGIEVTEGNTLNIFAQSEGANAGKLKAIATSEDYTAGIGGGWEGAGGTVTIYGGSVEAHGGYFGAGIGGGWEAAGGTVTIYGGTVETCGGQHGAGIGGGDGDRGGMVTIYGGIVKAHGGDSGAGIGGGYQGSEVTVTIYGGTVEAHGGDAGAGIGVGYSGSGGEVIIYGGTVEAHGGGCAAGIGGGYTCAGGEVTIYGGTVEAYGGGAAAGIGGGYVGSGITVTIYGGVVETHSESGAAGIGAGLCGESHGTLKIGDGLKVYDIDNPSTPIATGPQENVETRRNNMFVGKMSPVSYLKYSFDEDTKTLTSKKRLCGDYTEVTSGTTTFSNGWYVLNSSVAINDRIYVSGTVNLILPDGCTVEAKKGIDVAEGNTLNIFAQSEGANAGKLKATMPDDEMTVYAVIGGGDGKACGTVTIYGGSVDASRFASVAAGIGGGHVGAGGTVTVYGGYVKAMGGASGAGIGGGLYGNGGTFKIYGGTVEAYGLPSDFSLGYGAGIGGGQEGAGGTVEIYGGLVKATAGQGGAGGKRASGIGGGYKYNDNGTLKIGDGIKVYGGDSANPTTVIATGPKDNVGGRYRYMIVGGHIKGDANDDWKVNTADIVEMVNAANDKASTRFVLKNADIDGSGNITQEDIDAVVKIIMQK